MKDFPKTNIAVDNMSNDVLYRYGAFPERLYIVQDGTVKYAGGEGPHCYVLPEVEAWIKEYTNKLQ